MKRITVFSILILVLIGSFFLWFSQAQQPVNPQDTRPQTLVIAKGEGIREISANLKQQGFIKSPIAFFLLLKELGIDGRIEAGTFTLSHSMTATDVAQALTHGTNDIWVTIPEGKRAAEINEILMHKMPLFTAAWKDRLQEEEGYLFPDTYRFSSDSDIENVISVMRDNFEAKYVEAAKNQTTTLLQKDAVILASIVEREGKSAQEMKTIASVLENRLQLGMALQTDATVQYALATKRGGVISWWPTVSPEDLKIESAYNTYTNPGLPPTPISNPGFTALSAVLHPAVSNYLFYFTDGKGVTHFAKTLTEQNENIVKYGN